MKKLKLKNLNLSNAELLTRDQLRSLKGGESGSGGSGPYMVWCLCWDEDIEWTYFRFTEEGQIMSIIEHCGWEFGGSCIPA